MTEKVLVIIDFSGREGLMLCQILQFVNGDTASERPDFPIAAAWLVPNKPQFDVRCTGSGDPFEPHEDTKEWVALSFVGDVGERASGTVAREEPWLLEANLFKYIR